MIELLLEVAVVIVILIAILIVIVIVIAVVIVVELELRARSARSKKNPGVVGGPPAATHTPDGRIPHPPDARRVALIVQP